MQNRRRSKRRTFHRRVRKSRSRRQGAGNKSSNIFIANPFRPRPTKVVQSQQSFQVIAGPNTVQDFNIIDPSGNYGTVLGGTAASQIMPDWNTYAALFSHFKLLWCKYRISIVPTSAAAVDYSNWGIKWYHRYMYQEAFTVTTNNLETLPKLKIWYPTPTDYVHEWKVYPRVFIDQSTTAITSGQRLAKPGWMLSAAPGPMYGSVDYSVIPTGFTLTVDITYCVKFKSMK